MFCLHLQEVEGQLAGAKSAKISLDKALKQSAATVSQLTQDLTQAESSKSAVDAELQKLSQQLAATKEEKKQLDSHNGELDRKLAVALGKQR